MKIAEDGIKMMTELNKRRYPLLTMKTLLEFQKKHNIKSGLLVIQFNGNVGPKTNNEVSTDINKVVKPAVDSLQDSIISVLKEHIDKLNNKINSTYAETFETIGIHTERSGEARNLMSRKSREINMDYEKKRLNNYCKNLKPDTQTNAPTKKKPSAKKNENSVLTELAKLIAKHK